MPDQEVDWAGPRPLRLATILSFIPAFPLCIAHGVISKNASPAVGLAPLAVSAVLAIALLQQRHKSVHPAAIFAADAVLSAALLVVLVFTWLTSPHTGVAGLSMLAAYATIPLLVNFLVHLSLALRAIYIGLALDSLVQWTAWQTLPPDCPSCNARLRPPFPSFPWFNRAGEEYARLFVSDEENRYRDNEDEDTAPAATAQPPIQDVTRKDRKGKNTSSAAEDTAWTT